MSRGVTGVSDCLLTHRLPPPPQVYKAIDQRDGRVVAVKEIALDGRAVPRC